MAYMRERVTDGVCLREREIVLGHCESETDWRRGNTSLGVDGTFRG